MRGPKDFTKVVAAGEMENRQGLDILKDCLMEMILNNGWEGSGDKFGPWIDSLGQGGASYKKRETEKETVSSGESKGGDVYCLHVEVAECL